MSFLFRTFRLNLQSSKGLKFYLLKQNIYQEIPLACVYINNTATTVVSKPKCPI